MIYSANTLAGINKTNAIAIITIIFTSY
jgi:hypothetical protein